MKILADCLLSQQENSSSAADYEIDEDLQRQISRAMSDHDANIVGFVRNQQLQTSEGAAGNGVRDLERGAARFSQQRLWGQSMQWLGNCFVKSDTWYWRK